MQKLFKALRKSIIMPIAMAMFLHVSVFAEEFQRYTALPFASYSEETKIQYGAMFVLFFKPFEGGKKVSSIDFVAMGTQNDQYQFRTKPEFYLVQDHVHIPMEFQISDWCGKIFERGSRGSFDPIAKYDRFSLSARVPVEMNFGIPAFLPLQYGFVAEVENRDNTLKGNSIAGKQYDDATFGGGGYRIVSDLRDNKNWPTLGYYASFEQILYRGNFEFHSEEVDIRAYAPLFWTTSIATAIYWKQVRGGDVPFGYLAGPDGTSRFRGVDPGLWNDTQVLIGQLEFRKTLFWRLAGTIFGEWMQSGENFGELFKDDFHYAIGFGGRLALNRSEKLHARGDISFIDGKHIGLTVYLREAF